MTLQLTNSGINALLRATAGDSLTLSCVKIGNGAAQAAGAATDLSNPLVTLNITECTVANQRATISVTLNNSTIDAGFRLTEIGVFAQDQDDSTEEILYAYGTEPEATADYIAASGDNILEEDITIDVFVGNAENVSAIINESLVYATKAAFDAHVANHENPHAVTKAQVGLSNVPNVATDDQTPTYTEATSDTNLTSGERLTVAMGKIARAVRSLIGHLANKNNPHAVTATQVGAATSGHKHSAADVTTGVLGVARGGTGTTSLKDAGIEIVPYFFNHPSTVYDLDDVTTPGFYSANYNVANKPADADPTSNGYLLIFASSYNSVQQIYLSCGSDKKIFTRSKINGSSWRIWE